MSCYLSDAYTQPVSLDSGNRCTKSWTTSSESKLVPYLLENPGKENQGRPYFHCIEFDVVEYAVRIETATAT
jgi:hypothetical protein